MPRSRRFLRAGWLASVGGVLWLSGLPAGASEIFVSQRTAAIEYAREGRCEVALEIFTTIQAEFPNDALVAQLTGECALRAQRFRLAEEALGRARSLDPETPEVDLHLAIAHFHQGEIDEAAAALGRAAAADSDQPEFLLYSGLIALERSEFVTAASALGAASRVGGRSMEPMASFFSATALAELARVDEAQAALDRVIAEFPETAWSDRAARAKEDLEAQAVDDFHYWTLFELGFEHDDNVVLRGNGVPLPNEISGQSDQRGFWAVDSGVLVDLDELWRIGGLLRYGGTSYADLSEFDSQALGSTIWLDRLLDETGTSLRLEYDLDGVWVNQDPFVVAHLGTISYYKPWEDFGSSVVSGSYEHRQYYYPRFQVQDVVADPDPTVACPPSESLCGPAGINERTRTDRTGDAATVSLLHLLPFEFENPIASGLYVSGEYLYHRYWARGAEYDHQRHQVEIEAGATLPFDVFLKVGGRFAYSSYDNNSVFPDPPVPRIYTLPSRQRRDRESGVWVEMSKALMENITLGAYFRRIRNRSNTEVFDYDQNAVGASLRVALGG